MNFKQTAHFLKLKKAYAYDVALSKKDLNLSEEDLYESLSLLHLNSSLTDVANDFMSEYEAVHEGEEAVCVLTSIAFLLVGVIRMEAELGNDAVDLKLFFDELYDSIAKDKDDEN